MIGITAAILFWVVGAISVAAGVLLLTRRRPGRPGSGASDASGAPGDVAFLFQNGRLIDATPAARRQLPQDPEETDDLGRFSIAFGQRFGGISAAISGLAEGEEIRVSEVPDDPGSQQLVASLSDGRLRVRLEDPLREERDEKLTHYSLAAMRAELLTLRAIAERSPVATWKRRDDGCVVWANSRYVTLAREVAGEAALIGWPPPDLFETVEADAAAAPGDSRRISLTVPESGRVKWFDLLAVRGEIETLFFAIPIDKLVRAESALTEFVDTLTKTFAHLRVGLAIFDSRRRLVLFNPALADLTGLPAEQLSCRPTLHAFLDALRDAQRIPEPKDYKSWRMHMAQLETGAADGTVEETWHLPNGQTFRVSGRPHPDGAVAFMFEDISDEVSVARDHRLRLDLNQAVFDSLDIGVAAFSGDGLMVLSNAAYNAAWATDGETRQARRTFRECVAGWALQCREDSAAESLLKLARAGQDGISWQGDLVMSDGAVLACALRTVPGGAVLATFTPGAASARGDAGCEVTRLLA